MMTYPRDLVAVPAPMIWCHEAALKQLAVLFNRIAIPGLSKMLTLPNTHLDSKFAKRLEWLAETGILFEPVIEKLKTDVNEDYKSRLRHDVKELYKPVGLSLDDLLAAREDENKALEVKSKMKEWPTYPSASLDLVAMFKSIQRMTLDSTRLCALQLRNVDKLDAHAIVPSEFSFLDEGDEGTDEDDEAANKYDVVKIVVNALPVPDEDTSWQHIVEYRNDPNSLNRFLELRNWISATARGKLTALEVDEKLGPVLKRFSKQMEIHQLKTDTTTFEAFVVTTAEVLGNLFSYGGHTLFQRLSSIERRKLVLLKGESPSEDSEVVYVIKTRSLFTA